MSFSSLPVGASGSSTSRGPAARIVEMTEDLVVFWCAKGKKRRQGVRESFRWATPRCWEPERDALAKAITLIRDVATKAPEYQENPFLVPDLATDQSNRIGKNDSWLPRPMSYSKFVTLFREFITDITGDGSLKKLTFNALRRLTPTGADVLQFDDAMAAAIENWQDVPKGGGGRRWSKMKDRMAVRYAGDAIRTAGHYKLRVVAAIWDVEGPAELGGQDGLALMRHRYPDRKVLKQLTMRFRVKGEFTECDDIPKCLAELPKGPLKHRPELPLRVIPAPEKVCWMMQTVPTHVRRPVVHFAASSGDAPYCRSTKFRRAPAKEGRGVVEAARTGERPCLKCTALMGDMAQLITAEFCVADDC